MLAAALVLSVFVGLLSGLEMKCTVSHNGDRTTYNLLNVFCDKDTKKPEFSWFNKTKHVLANHRGQMEMVLSSSFNAFVTTGCIENLLCEGHVISEGIPLDYMANCTTTCPPKAHIGDEGMPLSWIAAIVVVAIILLLACVVGFLCRKHENLRKCSCGQTGGLYSFVKNRGHKAEDVEAGNN